MVEPQRAQKDAEQRDDEHASFFMTAVAPYLQPIAHACRDEGVPLVSVTRDGPDAQGVRLTAIHADAPGNNVFRWLTHLARAGSIDGFMQAMIRDAAVNGHESLYLRAMGIAHAPQPVDKHKSKGKKERKGGRT